MTSYDAADESTTVSAGTTDDERPNRSVERHAPPWMTTVLLLLGMILALSTGLVAVDNTPASAQETGNATSLNEEDSQHWWDNDGCSVVPDAGVAGTRVTVGSPPFTATVFISGAYDFHHACVHHDGCYRNHWADKGTCDQWFLNDMNASCEAIDGNEACYDRARLYYWGVRVFGGNAYQSGSVDIPMDAYLA